MNFVKKNGIIYRLNKRKLIPLRSKAVKKEEEKEEKKDDLINESIVEMKDDEIKGKGKKLSQKSIANQLKNSLNFKNLIF